MDKSQLPEGSDVLFASLRARYVRYALASLVFVSLFALLPWFLWDSWPRLGAVSSTLGIIASAVAVVSVAFSFLSAYRATQARITSERVVEDLVHMGLLVDRVGSYEEAFEHHVTRHMHQSTERLQTHGDLYAVRFLISTPVYGYHVLGDKHSRTFRNSLRSLDVPLELILYSPDYHVPHVLNTLFWQHLPVRSDELQPGSHPRTRSRAEVLANEISDILVNLRQDCEEDGAQVWATYSGHLRISFFDFARGPQTFVLLSDRVTLWNDLLQFNVRFMPLARQLINQIVRDRNSYYEQQKVCPYSGWSGEAASLQEEDEFVTYQSDLLWMRTHHRPLSYRGFLIELNPYIANLEAVVGSGFEVEDELRRVATDVVSYFQFLRRKSGVRDVPSQLQVLNLIESLDLDEFGEVPPDEVADFLAPLQSRFLPYMGEPSDTVFRTIAEREEMGRWSLLLYVLSASGNELSEFGRMREAKTRAL